jgi:hypothetical protein
MTNFLRALILVALLPTGAISQGINLSWEDCGSTGTESRSWACDTNTGAPFTLVASFTPPAGVPEFLGISAQLDITVGSGLPDWWQHGSSFCRGPTAIATNFDFTSGPFTCFDFYAGSAAGGFAYDVGYVSPNRARWRIQLAVPFDNRGAIDPMTEYYAFKANLLRSRSTGAGSCFGCDAEACIVLNEIQLFQPPEQNNDPVISTAPPGGRNYALWQAATIVDCPGSTPARNATWGQLKSLYR